jgi:hypothetical protein
MKQCRVLVLMMCVAGWPATAHAARGWWGWLEDLSGPGPFNGPMYTWVAKCWDHDGSQVACRSHKTEATLTKAEKIRRTAELSFGALSSGNEARFKEFRNTPQDDAANRERVIAVPVNLNVMFRPFPWLEAGPGIGLLFFGGHNVRADPRVLILGSVHSKFLRLNPGWENSKLARVIAINVQGNFITHGFTAGDFGSTTATFKSKPEFKWSCGFVIDFREWY